MATGRMWVEHYGKVESGTIMVPKNCIIIHGGVLEYRDPLTGSYSLANSLLVLWLPVVRTHLNLALTLIINS
jgi:hypothetical protein